MAERSYENRYDITHLFSIEIGLFAPTATVKETVLTGLLAFVSSLFASTLCCFASVAPPATSINTLMVLSMRVCTFPHILIGRPFIELNIAHTAISIKQQS